ncbi:MAG: CPCC family cysteine-rich protein [Planctomycetota bacterium]
MRFPCACCGYLQLTEGGHGTFEICGVCFWEDDPVQFGDPDFRGGANGPSLREAQANFREFGAYDRDALPHVQAPSPEVPRDPEWKPL